MQEPHRARQRDLGGLDHDHLALDAAQLGRAVARGKAAAVDGEAGVVVCVVSGLEADRDAERRKPLVQLRQHAARLDMAFVGKEQRVAEAAVERGFEHWRWLAASSRSVAAGQLREAVEVGAVARMRHHQRAVERRVGELLAPELERARRRAG